MVKGPSCSLRRDDPGGDALDDFSALLDRWQGALVQRVWKTVTDQISQTTVLVALDGLAEMLPKGTTRGRAIGSYVTTFDPAMWVVLSEERQVVELGGFPVRCWKKADRRSG